MVDLLPTVPAGAAGASRDDERAADDESAADDLREILGMDVRRAPAALAIGQVIDAYRIDAELGVGGMGRVYRAYDRRLERDVAIKLHARALAPDDDSLRREGVALAKLAHPNVVAVYEVGTWAGHPWVAMEYVPGGTARAWRAAAPRTPEEIVALYVAAGRGLVAAHAAGLVHRDFKPDNILVGDDGRARVADFGLARATGVPTSEIPTVRVPPPDAVATCTTVSGAGSAVVGTPAYMAPEQRQGGRVGPAADQYAFAVSLWEALAGARPVHGATEAELAAAAAAGRIVAPAPGAMPRGVEAALRRALAPAPADRWPSLAALLSALDRDRGRRRRGLVVAAAAVGIAGAAAASVGGSDRGGGEPCAGGAAAIAASWGGAARDRAMAHLAGLPGPYAREAGPQIAGALDRYAASWADVHRGACEAHRGGELSAAMFDRRTACLAIRRGALATLAELAGTAGAEGLSGVIVAIDNAPAVATCADDAALLSPVAPPTPDRAAEAAAITDLIARADAERDADRGADAERDADAAVARAGALGYPPLVARAAVARGRLDLALGRGDLGAAAFSRAAELALAVGDEPLAVEAWARGAWATAATGDPARATDGLALVEAVTERIGDRAPFARALLHNNLGGVALARGDRGAARMALARADGEAALVTGPGAVELTAVLVNLLVVEDDPAARARIGAELVARRTALLGPNHAATVEARILAAELVDDPVALGAALGPPCGELRRLHPERRWFGAECAFELVWTAAAGRDLAAAGAALALVPDGEGGGPAAVAAGYRRLVAGDAAAAVAALGELGAPAADAPWWDVVVAADAELAIALAEEARRRPAAATRALAAAEALLARAGDAMPAAARGRRTRAIAAVRARLVRPRAPGRAASP